jgi:hypothetical protein
MKAIVTLTNQITKAEIAQEIAFTVDRSYASVAVNGKKLTSTIFHRPDGRYFFNTYPGQAWVSNMPCALVGIFTKTLEEMAERLAILYAPHILDGIRQPATLKGNACERARPAWVLERVQID